MHLIEQGQGTPNVDAYWMSVAPNTFREAEAHATGTVETITVVSGSLEAGNSGNTQLLLPGQSVAFSADLPHIYKTLDEWATCLITIVYHKETKE